MKNEVQKDQAPVQVVRLYEKHVTIHPRTVQGIFNNARWVMVFLTQIVFYGLCWVEWGERQAVLFHLADKKFYIFGLVLWPQDAIYLAALLVIAAYGLFLVTAIWGRLFCGYACPQTVYTEIFMWIERKIEGERPARLKLDAAPLSWRKFRIKFVKHAIWIVLSLWTGFTFVGYFTPIRELFHEIQTWSLSGWSLFWFLFYSAFLYMMAGFLREQMCKYMCPYARFQGVMFDPDTLIITYDTERGEPRGALRKNASGTETLGDCIDCGICVQVCPTGIDIRQGLQYECIACTACIDGCDSVMDKIGRPRGLVRYSTENGMKQKLSAPELRRHLLRPRTLIYSSILCLIVAAMAYGLSTRIPLKVDVLRDRTISYRQGEDESIENVFTLRIMNTDEHARRYNISAEGIAGLRILGEASAELPSGSTRSILIVLSAEEGAGKQGANPIVFNIAAEGNETIVRQEKAVFYMP